MGEAQQLRRIVKRVFRRGARDKDVLWTEVSNELASGRSPRECKAQYAREYRLHKAKEARQRDRQAFGLILLCTRRLRRTPSLGGDEGELIDSVLLFTSICMRYVKAIAIRFMNLRSDMVPWNTC